MAKYRNAQLESFKNQQLSQAQISQRLAQIERAEQLLAELSAEKEYAVNQICTRILGSKYLADKAAHVSGEVALHDVRLFVEDLTGSASIPVESVEEPVLTIEEVAELFQVSTKTVDRWRSRGLASRRFLFGKRKRIGFLQSSVDRFARDHAEEIERGSSFSQLSDSERQELIAGGRDLARNGIAPAIIIRRLAKKFDRSAETVRYTLKNHDKNNPGDRVLNRGKHSLDDHVKETILREFRRGVSVGELATSYNRSQPTVRRIVHEMRLKQLADEPIDYMFHEDFNATDAAKTILAEAPENTKRTTVAKAPSGLPPYLASLYRLPLLTKEQEVHYFRKMNYLKHLASQLREEIVSREKRVRAEELDRLEDLMKQATEIKNLLVRRNLRLVVSVAKKYLRPGANFFEMVSDGNLSLMRAIEKFDYGRGFKLSTYATWAIMKNFARSIPAEHRQLDRFRTGSEEIFQDSRDERTSPYQEELINSRQREVLGEILEKLNERERDILVTRYGLEKGAEPQTLEAVGGKLGVSKERVRQLEKRALGKLRALADIDKLEIPGV